MIRCIIRTIISLMVISQNPSVILMKKNCVPEHCDDDRYNDEQSDDWDDDLDNFVHMFMTVAFRMMFFVSVSFLQVTRTIQLKHHVPILLFFMIIIVVVVIAVIMLLVILREFLFHCLPESFILSCINRFAI